MADNILTYILELQDKISPKLNVINISNDKMLEKWSEVQVKMNAARKSIPDTGGTTKLSPRNCHHELDESDEWVVSCFWNVAAFAVANNSYCSIT